MKPIEQIEAEAFAQFRRTTTPFPSLFSRVGFLCGLGALAFGALMACAYGAAA